MRKIKKCPVLQIIILVIVIIALAIFIVSCKGDGSQAESESEAGQEEIIEEVETHYGIDYRGMVFEEGTIDNGQTAGELFARYGVSALMTDRADKACKDIFDLRKIQAGKNYTAFITDDSLSQLRYFVYEESPKDFIVISFEGDSVCVRRDQKDVTLKRRMAEATIESSLWNAMIAADMSPAFASELENVYAWTVDFFGLQKGDKIKVIYDEEFIDDKRSGSGQIWGAIFTHGGKDLYAIPFKQDGRISFWDENGASLRKSMLKAPLNYTRISSYFSNARVHPIYKTVRPHYGVDYAAPSGTPVLAVGDGTVIFKGWDSKGGGNVIKIKHNSTYTTGYLHLSGFAKGIATGARVTQGQVIGYVGSTGASTGPHLDYRIWQNGTPINPLKMVAEPAEPISDENKLKFEFVRDRILAELRGELPESERITQLDSIVIPTAVVQDTVNAD